MLHLQIYFTLGWLYSFSFGELLNQNFRFTSNYFRHLIIARQAARRAFCTHLQISELHLDCPSDLKHMQCTLAAETELYWQKISTVQKSKEGGRLCFKCVHFLSISFHWKYTVISMLIVQFSEYSSKVVLKVKTEKERNEQKWQ